MSKNKLNTEEKEIFEAFVQGTLKRIQKAAKEIKRHKVIAEERHPYKHSSIFQRSPGVANTCNKGRHALPDISFQCIT